MSIHHRSRPVRRVARAVACLAIAILALTTWEPGRLEARGGGGPAPAPANPRPRNPNLVMGARLFDQCVQWVAQGAQGITKTNDFFIRLNAELDLDQTKHSGPMGLWWQAPDKFRWETTANARTTTKILSGERMWIVQPDGRVRRMHGTSEGASAIKQLKEDRERMGDLAQFITLKSLKGPGVTFEFQGEKSGSGDFAGKWLKVVRRAPGSTRITFWLAYTRDTRGAYQATWPGIVRIDGDPAQKIPTEDYLLKDWRGTPRNQPRAFRYPRLIEGFSREPGRVSRFLRANVTDIKINTGIDPSRFAPPPQAGGGGRRR